MTSRLQSRPHRSNRNAGRNISLLVLGFAQGFSLPESCKNRNLSIQSDPNLTPGMLAGLLPDIVVMPLFNGHRDATTHLQLLQDIGFRGRCIVLAPPLPKPDLVRGELRDQARDLRITLLRAPHGKG